MNKYTVECHYNGYYKVFEDVPANTEREAIALAESLATSDFLNGVRGALVDGEQEE